ncbi:MAG: TauD/TfdA family dioxygenase [Nitrospira sp.]|nr:TauD/TfdA family dioxygenase [Nitrospira sp.]
MTLTINQLGDYLGAEVLGVDVKTPINEETFGQIVDAFNQYSILVFRDQDINDEQQIAFSKRFGPLESTMKNDFTGGGGLINNLSNVDQKNELIPSEDKRIAHLSANMLWHSDSSFKKIPAKASILSGREVPSEGGETEYASTRAAYAALPDEKRAMLEGLIAVHSIAYSRSLIASDLMTEEYKAEVPPVQQILVRTIPETGEKALFIGSHASHIVGWPTEKGRALLKELLEWTTQPQFVYQHKWRPKDLVMWDNRRCLHRGRPWDPTKYRRVMHRTTVAGDGPTV